MSLTMIEDIKGAVREAGQLALLYSGKVHKGLKADQSVVTEADNAVESFLRLSLTRLAPTYGYLGEETEETKPPGDGETRYWVVDALDGSRAFAAGIPLWTPAVCLMDGNNAVAGAAFNPITGELFWADAEGPAWCGDRPLRPDYSVELKPNTFILGPTNHHRSFEIDFPGRVYCLGAPIYQLCLLAKGAVKAFFFDPVINLWDLALPSLLLERVGGVLVYGSGRPVELGELRGRRPVPEPVFAGGAEMVAALRERLHFIG
ncbi:myo-inositol-1(or 4)-monophosphatase [Roseiarcus fermentans]|uniref:Myo-inositol-1(Or 4)-monophosphatase n=2 Tax=Roseiarcus fermentans TaxID=1473586 RepID=A0A366EKF4_9HYPH|nr:myo-inositol-1(or 4)-monophosphatase [Roseiarcus fermentans]